MMTQGQVLTSDPAKVVWGHRGHQQFLADKLRLRRARDMKVVSMCLFRQYASTDMQLGSSRDLDLRSNFDLTFQGHAIHVSMRLDEENTMVSKLLFYHFKHKLSLKNCSLKNAVFDLSWPLTLKRLILGEICSHLSERAFQELSFAFFGFGVAIIVPEILAGIPDKTIIFRKFDLWWPLLTSIFTWAKNDRNDFERAHKQLSIAVSSGLLAFLVFELEGGGSFWPPTMAKVAETATRARVKSNCKITVTIEFVVQNGP